MEKIDKLKKIKELLDSGAISQTEFDYLKENLLLSFNQKSQNESDDAKKERIEYPNIENYKKTTYNNNDNYLKSSAILLIIFSSIFLLNSIIGNSDNPNFNSISDFAFLVFGISIINKIKFRISGILMILSIIPLYMRINQSLYYPHIGSMWVSSEIIYIIYLISLFLFGLFLIINKSKLFIGISLVVLEAVYFLLFILNWSATSNEIFSIYLFPNLLLVFIGILFIRSKKYNINSTVTIKHNEEKDLKNLTVSEWIEIFLITIIPLVGIIFLCIWANDNKNKVRKNYAIATLYWIGILFLIILIIFSKLIRYIPGFHFLDKLF